MTKHPIKEIPGGVWSAAPTPFTEKMEVDLDSVQRMVEHHLKLGVQGLFLMGTNGEGPWMPDRERTRLVRAVVKDLKGRLPVAVQVSDNSAPRILDNIRWAADQGAAEAVIAPPSMLYNATPEVILDLYREAIRNSPLPVCIYDRGKAGPVFVPDEALRQIYLEPKVVRIKDSSMTESRRDIALEVKRSKPGMHLLTGAEFNCVDYLKAGYDGLLLGGGVFNGAIARRIIEAVRVGDIGEAERLQARMNRLMYDVYGGTKIECWLSGEKKLLVEMGLFKTWRNFFNYPLTASCESAIQKALKDDRDILMPWKKG
ncbi:MAG: dihydrodipicolinate synthase family protein [Lentisphaerae bacterium]|nr:dihydrodipicolinate synthase family protein [Lentisphaerota bacterium]